MAFDKLCDSAQLNAGLTSVANAIRAKTGDSGSIAFPDGFVSAIQSIPFDAGDMISGSFSPEENTYTPGSIDVGVAWDHMILFTLESAGFSNGIRTIRSGQFFEVENGLGFFLDISNAAGTASATYNKPTGEAARFSKSGNSLVISSNSSIGYFASGMTYKWFAWTENTQEGS